MKDPLPTADHIHTLRVGLGSQIKILQETADKLSKIAKKSPSAPNVVRVANSIRSGILALESALECLDESLKNKEV